MGKEKKRKKAAEGGGAGEEGEPGPEAGAEDEGASPFQEVQLQLQVSRRSLERRRQQVA